MIFIVFLLLIFSLLVFFSSKFLPVPFLNFLLIVLSCAAYLLFGLGDLTGQFRLVFIFLMPVAWATVAASAAALISFPQVKQLLHKMSKHPYLGAKHFFNILSGAVLLLTIAIHIFFYRPVYFYGLNIEAYNLGASGAFYQIDLNTEGQELSLGLTNPKLTIHASDEEPMAYDLYFNSYGNTKAIIRFFPSRGGEEPSFKVIQAEPGVIL